MVPQRFRKSPGAKVSCLQTSAAALALLAAASVPAVAGEPPSGFNYCAPPPRPSCIQAPQATDACELEVQAFIKGVFKYRTCLDKESDRAVTEANDVLEAWKCRSGAVKCR